MAVNVDALIKLIIMLFMFSILLVLVSPENWFIPTVSVCIGGFAGFTIAHDNFIMK